MPNPSPNYHPLVVFDSFDDAFSSSEQLGALSCPVALRCGGCPEFSYVPAEQRAQKGRKLQELLREQGVAVPGDIPWICGPTTRYRNRIRVALRDGVLGYFNQEKDPNCLVLEGPLLVALREWAKWAGDHRELLRAYRVAEVRTFDADRMAAVYLRHTERNGANLPAPLSSLLPDRFDAGIIAVEDGPLRTQRFPITSSVYAHVPVGGFMQINSVANRRMVEQVLRWALELGAASALDLFAGSGNFALPLSARGVSVTSVEADSASCWALRTSLEEQGARQVNVIAGDALTHAESLAARGEHFDVVVADPPRGGMRGRVSDVASLAVRAVILVGCDAARFSADVAAFTRAGLTLQSCVAVDMFPHTRHMEAMALLVRGS